MRVEPERTKTDVPGENHDLAAAAFEAAADGMAIYLASHGSGPPTFVAVNGRFEELFGYSNAEVAGRTAEVLFGPATSRTAMAELRRNIAAGRRYSAELRLYDRDGQVVWVDLNLSPMERGTYWVGSYRDIAHRKRSEEQLRILAAAFDAAAEIAFVTDATPLADGGPRILYANRQFFEETGLEPSEVVGEPISLVFGPTIEPDCGSPLAVAVEHRRESHVEVPAHRKDGGTFWFETHSRPVFDEAGRYVNRIFVGSNVTERRRLEERVRMLIDAIEQADENVVLYEADPRRMGCERLIYVNDAIVSRTGYSKEELYRDGGACLLGPATDRAAIERFVGEVRAGRLARLEAQLYRKDGSTYWCEISGRAIPSGSGSPIRWLLIERDTTARRAGEVWLRTLSSAIDNATDFVFVTDDRPLEEGGPRIQWANETMLTATGYRLPEMVGQSPMMLCGPQTDRNAIAEIREATVRHEQIATEFLAYRKDGSSYWVEFCAKLLVTSGHTSWIAVGRDITQRRAFQDLVAAESFTLATLYDMAQRFNASFDAQSLARELERGVSVLVNGRARLVSDLEQASVAGTNVGLAITLSDPPRQLSHNLVSAVQLAIQSYEAAARRAAVYVALEEQRTTMMALSAHKSELIAMLAHDFKNPLATILGFAEMMAEPNVTDDDRAVATKTIGDAANRLLALANDTLALAQIEENELVVNFEPLDYVALLGGVVNAFSTQRRLHFSHDRATIPAFGDFARLRQTFDNLVSNAIKYSPDRTPVDIEVSAAPGLVRVRITDYGIGIPVTEEERIFERFSRASNARSQKIGGTGLGLSFVKAVIEAHGGTITVDSIQGKRTTFEVALPLSPTRHERRNRPAFVIDADGDGRSFAAHALRRLGYTVKVHPGPEAVSIARLKEERARLVLDLERAQGSRPDLEAFMHAALRANVPVIQLADPATAILDGIPVLRKPFLEDELRAAMSGLAVEPVA